MGFLKETATDSSHKPKTALIDYKCVSSKLYPTLYIIEPLSSYCVTNTSMIFLFHVIYIQKTVVFLMKIHDQIEKKKSKQFIVDLWVIVQSFGMKGCERYFIASTNVTCLNVGVSVISMCLLMKEIVSMDLIYNI